MNYDNTLFLKDLEELNIEISKDQIDQFNKYYEMLVDWNSRMNLTSITEFEDVMKSIL